MPQPARSRTACEYLLALPMTPSSQDMGPPENPGRFMEPGAASLRGSHHIYVIYAQRRWRAAMTSSSSFLMRAFMSSGSAGQPSKVSSRNASS
jgi:hypothetical protein